MTSRPWYAFYPKDYEQKTAHLTILQDGAYRRLLDRYYMSGKPLPANADVLHRVCRAFAPDEQAAIAVVLAEFFVLGEHGYTQDRVEEELQKADSLSETRRKAANSRYSAPVHLQSKSTANAGHLHTQSQSQSQKKEDTPSLRSGVAARPRRKLATRWASERCVPREWMQAAGMKRLERGLPPIDLAYEAERFKNYWASKSGQSATKIDWFLMWLNWATDKTKTETGNGRSSQQRKPTPHDNFNAGIASYVEKLGRDESKNGPREAGGDQPSKAGPALLETRF